MTAYRRPPSRAISGVRICVTCEDERDTPLLTVFSRHFSKASQLRRTCRCLYITLMLCRSNSRVVRACRMLVLLDNNFVDRDGLRAYLEALGRPPRRDPAHRFRRVAQGHGGKVTRRVLQQACLYSLRIVILRDTNSILQMRGQPRVTPQNCGRCSNQFGNLTALPPRKRWRE